MNRPTRYFGGVTFEEDPDATEFVLMDGLVVEVPAREVPKQGTRVWDPNVKALVYVGDFSPGNASKYLLGGEPVFCALGGETLDFGEGPVHVSDATEKRKYMKKMGVMPAPTGMPMRHDPKQKDVKSFAQFFYERHGMGLKDFVESRYGDIPAGATVNLEFD